MRKEALYKSDKKEQCFEKISSFFSKNGCATMFVISFFHSNIKETIMKGDLKLCNLKKDFWQLCQALS